MGYSIPSRGLTRPERRGFPRLQSAMPVSGLGGIGQRRARDAEPDPSARGSGRGPAGDGKASRSGPPPVALRVSSPLRAASAGAPRGQLRGSARAARSGGCHFQWAGPGAPRPAPPPGDGHWPGRRAGRAPPRGGGGPERMNEARVGGERPPERGAQRGGGTRTVSAPGGAGRAASGEPGRRAGAPGPDPLTSGARQVPAADVGRGPEGGWRWRRRGGESWRGEGLGSALRPETLRGRTGPSAAQQRPTARCPPGYRMQPVPLPAASGDPPGGWWRRRGCVVGG